ncbi:MAG: SDR family NAD(P)-dependent oxidoreductase [Patescibacteria group bacterium]
MTNWENEQTKKIAVVTGGSSGIGAAIVDKLVNDSFEVFVIDKQEYVERHESVIHIETNLASPSQIKTTCKKIKKLTNKISLLINCAGIYPSIHWPEYTFKLWNECLAINVTAPFLLCQQFVPLLVNNGSGQIINITSGAVYLGSRDPGYSASKSALTGLTKSLAKNLSQFNILVNAIAPGPINTPMSRKGMRPSDIKKYVENIPLGRFGEAQEVAALVHFLASGNATFQTGSTIHINGGLYMN